MRRNQTALNRSRPILAPKNTLFHLPSLELTYPTYAKLKIIFPATFKRGYVSSLEGTQLPQTDLQLVRTFQSSLPNELASFIVFMKPEGQICNTMIQRDGEITNPKHATIAFRDHSKLSATFALFDSKRSSFNHYVNLLALSSPPFPYDATKQHELSPQKVIWVVDIICGCVDQTFVHSKSTITINRRKIETITITIQ